MITVLKTAAAALIAAAIAVSGATPTEAGGVFGPGGLIGGDVGNWIDKHVEHPILTPLARTATVAAGAVVAIAVAGPEAAPVGALIGEAVNQAVGPGQPEEVQVAAIETGATCLSPVVGGWQLPQPLPLNVECTVSLGNGKEFPGTVVK